MSYIALYRKFRPQTFDQVKGQDHVVTTLKNQLLNHRIGHAYLFTGTRGTGKTSAAKIFAKAVNCLHPVNGEPCNECENCRAINAGSFVDVSEVDAASNNGVEDIRRIIEEVRYTPVKGEYKVFIIDEAHMITGPAFNAFLKTLEEPPKYAIFILATTEPHKLPITILSRCQRYDFRRITSDYIVGNLSEIVNKEGVDAEEKALRYIARIGDGSMRDSISLLDKCIAFNLGRKLTYESVLDTLGTVDTVTFSALFRNVYRGDVAGALNIIDGAVTEGRDLTQFVSDFVWYLRNLLLVNATRGQNTDMLGISAENMELLMADAQAADGTVLIRYIRILSELMNRIRYSVNKQVLLEVAVIKLARPQMETDMGSLADRIRQLEAGGGYVQQMPQGQFIQPQQQIPPAQFTQPAPAQYVQQQGMPGMNTPVQGCDSYDDPFFDLYEGGQSAQIVYDGDFGADMNRQPDIPQTASVPQDMAGQQMLQNNIPQQPQPQVQPVQTQPQAEPAGTNADNSQLWAQIVNSCDDRMIRMLLNKLTASVNDEGTLTVTASENFYYKQLKEEGIFNYINNLAAQAAGRPVKVLTALQGSAGAAASADAQPQSVNPDPVFPDNFLSNINFNIGTEEY